MAALEELIAVTQEKVGAIVKKPKMSSKLLSRPPFRFLHDVVMNVHAKTGFVEGLFSEQECDSSTIKEKSAKVEFLQKSIIYVSYCCGEKAPCKPQKIVAGLEPENTNIFLQMIARAATERQKNWPKALKKTLAATGGGGAPPTGGESKQPEKKSRRPSAQDDEAKEPEPKPTSEARRGSNSDSRRGSTSSQASSGSATPNVQVPGVDGNWQVTVDLFKGVITKPKLSEKLLGKPPFRFIHDITTQTMKNVPGFLEGVFEGSELDAKQITDKQGKIAFLAKLCDFVSSQFGTAAPARPAKIVAGLEPQNTNKLLQMIALCAKGLGSEDGDGEEKQDAGDALAKQEAKEADLTPQQKPSKAAAAQEEKHQEDAEEPKRVARPATARKRPPKLRNNVQEIESRPGGQGEAGAAARPVGVMLEGEHDSDDDDDMMNMGADPVLVDRDLGDNNGSVDENAPKGKLVRDILNEEKEDKSTVKPENDESKQSTGVNLGKIGSSLRKGKGGVSAVDIDQLRRAIQTLCQSTNPLGKCMDYVHEDMEIMGKELERWRVEYRSNCDALEEEQRKTEDELLPMKHRLREVEEELNDQVSKISAIKAKIARNELVIQDQMRNMVIG